MSEAVTSIDHGEDHHGPDHGFKRWLFTTNHKDIGTLYLTFSLIMFFIAGTMALLIRVELFEPGKVLLNPEMFNQMTTMHGLIMVIGAPDMALPRLNNWSFWLLPFAFSLLGSTLFMSGPAPDFGWTFYAPLSTTFGPKTTDFFIFSIHLMGASSIMAALNIVVTIFNMRAPGMTWFKMPIFVWSWFVTAFLL